ncbi:hypothetical protein BGZ67_005914 [Mortierella alpina]|nr:hypothetical protein BGZ67_005914 [Mortierella alpina]
MDTMRATVFDIPHLVDIIAQNLATRDIYRCTLTSRQLRDAFQRCLYTCISMHQEASLYKFCSKEAADAFSRHLSCIGHFKSEDLNTKTSILSLLEASSTLQVVHLSDFPDPSDALILRLARIIREKGRRLKTFRVEGPNFRALAREALASNSSRSHPARSEATEVAKFSQDNDKIEFAWKELGHSSLVAKHGIKMLLKLLQMCPFMERMAFPWWIEQDVITHLAPVVATTMPQLCHLDLTNFNKQPLGTCRLVQSCKNLRSLILDTLEFDSSRLVDAVIISFVFTFVEKSHSSEDTIPQRSLLQQQSTSTSRCARVSHQFHDAFQHGLYAAIIHEKATLEARRASSRHFSQVMHPSPVTTLAIRALQEPDCFAICPDRRALKDHEHSSEGLDLRLAKIISEKGRQLKDFRMDYLTGFISILDRRFFNTLLWSSAAVEILQLDERQTHRSPGSSFAETLSHLKALAREALSGNGSEPDQTQAAAIEMVEFSQETYRIEFALKELGPGLWLVGSELEEIVEVLQMCPFVKSIVFP